MEHLIDSAWKTITSIQGDLVEVKPSKGRGWSVHAIFREHSYQVSEFGGSVVETTDPHILIRYFAGDIRIHPGDYVHVRGKKYFVNSSIIDGHGNYRLELHEQD